MVTKKTKVLVLSILAMAFGGVSNAIFATAGQANSLDSEAKTITVLNDGDVLIQDQEQNQHSPSVDSSSVTKPANNNNDNASPMVKLSEAKPKPSLISSLAAKLSRAHNAHTNSAHNLQATKVLDEKLKPLKPLPNQNVSASSSSSSNVAAAPSLHTNDLSYKLAQSHDQHIMNAQLALLQTKQVMPKVVDGGVLKPSASALAASSSPVLQLEMEIDKGAHYKVFSLSNPDRLVVDVKNSKGKTEFDKASFVNTAIKNIRTSQFSAGTFRIVFDLKEKLAFSTREIPVNNDNVSTTKKLVISLFAETPKKINMLKNGK